MSTKMPDPILSGKNFNVMISSFAYASAVAVNRRPGRAPDVMSFYLPPFQRPFVWTLRQQQRLIESLWLGLDIGRFVYTEATFLDGVGLEFDRLLIDGQQRLTTIERYFADAFPVFGATWSELDVAEQCRLNSQVIVPCVVISDRAALTWHKLEELYERMNYGGTPHTPKEQP